jgi:hypothetical protein
MKNEVVQHIKMTSIVQRIVMTENQHVNLNTVHHQHALKDYFRRQPSPDSQDIRANIAEEITGIATV